MKLLVTGGGGFLGGAIVDQALARGYAVRSFSRGRYPELAARGVETISGEIAEPGAVQDAVDGCDAVIHVAAKTGVWGPYRAYYQANVAGTKNVVAACRKAGVQKLVHTSTPSVVFRGRDEEGVDERATYAGRYLCHYPKTKAEAERIVLDADGNELNTVALRPHLIWGPGDTNLTKRVLERGRAGKLALVGDGTNLVDATYVDNAAEAHLLALDRLGAGRTCNGQVYFITNGEPWPIGKLLNEILEAGGIAPVERSILPPVAYGVGWMMEIIYGLLRKKEEPLMTRFVARQLATAHWYDISAAREDLGYSPRVSMEEGLTRLRDSLRGN